MPYITLLLKDVTMADASQPSLTDDGQVYCQKMAALSNVLSAFLRFQVCWKKKHELSWQKSFLRCVTAASWWARSGDGSACSCG